MVTTAEEERNSAKSATGENPRGELCAIADIFVEEFDAPLQVLTASEDDGIVYGNLISSGEFYSYAFDNEQLGFVHHQVETDELNDYADGLLGGYGVRTDSDSPYEYTFGLLRIDAQVRCTKGGTPCGKICLPKGAVCRKYGGGGTTGGKLKSGGGGSLAGGIAGGLAVTAAAGAVGGLAYINRKNLTTGGKAVAERLKRAGTEGRAELKTGLSAAKQSLKEGFNASKEINRTFKSAEGSVDKKYKSGANLLKRGGSSAAIGTGIGGAAGATVAGVENAARAVGRNLRGAGKDVALTASNSANTTRRSVEKKVKPIVKPVELTPEPVAKTTKKKRSLEAPQRII